MKKLIKKLTPIDSRKKCLNVVVETPKGSRVKYAYDFDTGFFILSKAMPAGMVFPFNFGFVPNTLAEDGDPLDVLILNEEPLISGCLLKVLPIAVIKATQTEKRGVVRNDRIIGQAIPKEAPEEFQSLKLEKKLTGEIELFFATYNETYGKKFKVLKTGGAEQAWARVRQAIKMRRKKRGQS